MEEEKSRGSLYASVTFIIIGGIILAIVGLAFIDLNLIAFGASSILLGILLGSLGNSIYDIRDASVQHLKIVQEKYNRPIIVPESGSESTEGVSKTLDWSRNFVKGWPLQIIEFQITNSKGENRGKISFKSLAQETIDYIELEIEYWDYLRRKLEFDEKSVLRGLVNLLPNGVASIDGFILPDLVEDVQVTLVGVRYKSGEVALMPAEVERYTLPAVKKVTGYKDFIEFISSYLEGKGFDVMPTYYYDSTPTHWNCVFCGTINEQRDNACASCKRERQIQHFARKEFLWKKFEERSSI